MTAVMESLISTALTRWRFIERALHSSGEWTMRYEGVEVEASRNIHDDEIEFVAEIPPFCYLREPSTTVTICEDGEPVRTFEIDLPVPECGGEISLGVSPIPVSA